MLRLVLSYRHECSHIDKHMIAESSGNEQYLLSMRLSIGRTAPGMTLAGAGLLRIRASTSTVLPQPCVHRRYLEQLIMRMRVEHETVMRLPHTSQCDVCSNTTLRCPETCVPVLWMIFQYVACAEAEDPLGMRALQTAEHAWLRDLRQDARQAVATDG